MSTSVTTLAGREIDADEWALRVDLAAAFRLAVEFDWHESVGNHFSAMLGRDERKFLINPRWKHFSLIKASDLLLMDLDDEGALEGDDAPDSTAWCIHSQIHAKVSNARVLFHLHPPYATALAGLKDPNLKPIDQVTARFFNRVAVDQGFGGMADNTHEGARLARVLGNKSIMMMGNHGVAVGAPTVAEAFEDLYLMERACRTMVLAYSTNQPLNIMPDDLAEKTAQGWEPFVSMAFAHFDQLKAMLDQKDPSYAT